MHKSITLALFACLLWAGAGLAQESVANLKTVSGQVSLVRGEMTMPAPLGSDLQRGDILRTGQNSAVGVTFLDGTRVSLGAGSEMQITAYRFDPGEKDYAFEIYMAKGTAVYATGKFATFAPEAVKFTTPQARIGVRGTRFLVKVD